MFQGATRFFRSQNTSAASLPQENAYHRLPQHPYSSTPLWIFLSEYPLPITPGGRDLKLCILPPSLPRPWAHFAATSRRTKHPPAVSKRRCRPLGEFRLSGDCAPSPPSVRLASKPLYPCPISLSTSNGNTLCRENGIRLTFPTVTLITKPCAKYGPMPPLHSHATRRPSAVPLPFQRYSSHCARIPMASTSLVLPYATLS